MLRIAADHCNGTHPYEFSLSPSDTFSWAFWCSLAFSLATAVLSLFFVFRAIWPPTKSSRCSCRNVFVIPCFVLLVFLSWTFAIVFVIGSIGLADMCFNSPDENMKALLERMQSIFSPLIYKSILFYISGTSYVRESWILIRLCACH